MVSHMLRKSPFGHRAEVAIRIYTFETRVHLMLARYMTSEIRQNLGFVRAICIETMVENVVMLHFHMDFQRRLGFCFVAAVFFRTLKWPVIPVRRHVTSDVSKNLSLVGTPLHSAWKGPVIIIAMKALMMHP